MPPSSHVPPPWFLTTSTAYSARRSRVCCTPVPDRVRRISDTATLRNVSPPRGSATHIRSASVLFHRRFYPSKTTPQSQPRACLHARVPSCSLCLLLCARFASSTPRALRRLHSASGLCSVTGAGQPTPLVRTTQTPHLPWALTPLQGLDTLRWNKPPFHERRGAPLIRERTDTCSNPPSGSGMPAVASRPPTRGLSEGDAAGVATC